MNQNRDRQSLSSSRIIRLVSLNALGGAGLGGVCVGLLIASDFAGLASLMNASREPGAALALLAGGFAATFAALSAATAVMLIPENERDERRGGGPLVPIPIRVQAKGERVGERLGERRR